MNVTEIVVAVGFIQLVTSSRLVNKATSATVYDGDASAA